jgi:hypothetical protein
MAERGELFRGVNNVSYLRVYVPEGSTLLAADGFEAPSSTLFETPLLQDGIDPDEARFVQAASSTIAGVAVTQEFGRTAFGGWIQLRPGETRVTRFRYRLPFSVFDLAEKFGKDGVGERAEAAYTLLLTSQSGKAERAIRTHVELPSNWKVGWSNVSDGSSPLMLERPWNKDQVVAATLSIH